MKMKIQKIGAKIRGHRRFNIQIKGVLERKRKEIIKGNKKKLEKKSSTTTKKKKSKKTSYI